MASGSAMIGVAGASLSPSTTYYGAMGMGSVGFQATEINVRTPFFSAGSANLMTIRVVVNSRTASSTLITRKNGANGNQTITIPATTTGEFQDVTNVDTIAINDQLNYQIDIGSGGTSFVLVSITMRYVVANKIVTKCIVQEAPPVVVDWTVNIAGRFSVPCGGADTAFVAPEIAATRFQVKAAFTAKNFWVRTGTSSASKNCTLGFRVNGTEVANVTIGALSDQLTTVPGGSISLVIDDAIDFILYGIPSTTGTTEIIAFGFDLESTTGQSQLIGGYNAGQSVGLIGPQYVALAGLASMTATSTIFLQRILQSTVLSFLEIVIKTNGYTSSAAFTFIVNTTNMGGILISSGTTGVFIDATNTAMVGQADNIQGTIAPSATGTTMVFTLVGMLATASLADIRTKSRFFQQIQHH